MPDTPSPEAAIAAARALVPRIVELRSDTEELRHLPDAIVAGIRESGLCRVALPSTMGGLELHPVRALEVFEELAASEASVAWIVWNNALPCFFSRFLSDAARAHVFADPRGMYTSSTRPTGKAVVDPNGYRVSGRWTLVSGCVHADWIAFMCVVEEGGEVRMHAPGAPFLRTAYLPEGSYRIIDTWNAGGLRGTGSHDVVVDDVLVPAEHTADILHDPSRIESPIGRQPIICTMAAGHASICLGVARAALDAVTELGRTKTSVDPVPDIRDRPSNQRVIATAATKIAALRGHLHAALGSLWGKVETGTQHDLDDIAAVYSAAALTQIECKATVSALYEMAGSSAVYSDFAVERCHRDLYAAAQHIAAQPFWLEEAGRVRLGLSPTVPIFGL